MLVTRHLLATLALLGASIALPPSAHAAESYDNCTGFITSLPATISTQGVWCLNKHLSTALSDGAAIRISTNNVTIDCNDFKIGNLAAGDTSTAYGIYADARNNAIVRQCGIRGFYYGIYLSNGAGHLIEDNRLDNNLYAGIYINGDNNRIRRNAIYDTGGFPASNASFGISGSADLTDNTVSGVFAAVAPSYPIGIYLIGSGNEARGNLVRGLLASTGEVYGIRVAAPATGVTIDHNRISAEAATPGTGIDAGAGSDSFCTDNTVVGFTFGYANCGADAGNLSL